MELNVEMLGSVGGFIGGPVKKQVSWESGGEENTADVYIRPMSYHTAASDSRALKEGGNILAIRIAEHVCHQDGSPVFRVEDITGINKDGSPVMIKQGRKKVERGPLCKSLSDALIMLITEVSGLGKTTAKKS